MEARDDNDDTSTTNSWKDTAFVSVEDKVFQKNFEYEYGFLE